MGRGSGRAPRLEGVTVLVDTSAGIEFLRVTGSSAHIARRAARRRAARTARPVPARAHRPERLGRRGPHLPDGAATGRNDPQARGLPHRRDGDARGRTGAARRCGLRRDRSRDRARRGQGIGDGTTSVDALSRSRHGWSSARRSTTHARASSSSAGSASSSHETSARSAAA